MRRKSYIMAKNKQAAKITITLPFKTSVYLKLSGKWVLLSSRSSLTTLQKALNNGYEIIFK